LAGFQVTINGRFWVTAEDFPMQGFGRIFPRSNEGKLLCPRELREFWGQDVVMLFEYLS